MIHSPQSKFPREFQNFLQNGEDETRLIELIFQVISQESSRALQMLKCDEIYCLKESYTVATDSNELSDIDDLKSDQEEADTKVIHHYLDALKEPETTVVLRSHSGDTNIMVLDVALIIRDCDYGNGKNRKAICLADIIMNENEKDALFGFHAFSGNDNISGFFRKGRSSGWKCTVKTEKFAQLFADFSKSCELEESHLLLLEEFLCNLYGYKCRNIILIQCKMFQKRVTQAKRAPDISLLPPCRSVFQLHARRSIFVANMWRSTPTAWLLLPDFTRFG